jgi:iron complex outermembrane receptor protein
LYGDIQARWAEFSYEGDIDLGSVDWTFLDPRVGFRWFASPRLSAYASVGRAQREPTRMDLLLGEDNATVMHDLRAVEPEEVVDFEAGVNLNTSRLGLQANVYSMEFTNEIALTGELSAVGLPLRRNVDDSFRRGLEVDLRFMVSRNWTILHSSNLSHNRISSWTQYYDVYDPQGNWIDSQSITHRDVPPLLTPEVIFNLGAEWSIKQARIALIGRYVGDSHLDNTGSDDFIAPAYANLDLRASIDLGRWWSGATPRLTFYVNNLLDDLEQYPSGYSYQFIVRDPSGPETIDGIPFYYPLAGRNLMAKLAFAF